MEREEVLIPNGSGDVEVWSFKYLPPVPMRDETLCLLIEYLKAVKWTERQIVNLLTYISYMTGR